MSDVNGDSLDCVIGRSELNELRRDKARLDWLAVGYCALAIENDAERAKSAALAEALDVIAHWDNAIDARWEDCGYLAQETLALYRGGE